MRAEGGHGAVNQGPTAANSARQQGRILVLGGHDNAESFKVVEVLGESQRYSGSASCKRRIGDPERVNEFETGGVRV